MRLHNQVTDMTNVPGHRTSQHLIEGEAYRRIMSGEAPSTLSEFAQQLSDWFRDAFPAASPVTPNAIEKQIHDTWHRRHEMIRGG
jgi:hypothetical protein